MSKVEFEELFSLFAHSGSNLFLKRQIMFYEWLPAVIFTIHMKR